MQTGKPVFLRDVAKVRDGPPPPTHYAWYGTAGEHAAEHPAVTLAITKKPGENAIDVANAVMARAEQLKNTVIPADVQVAETRNYGASANDKAQKLIQKLLFATASVVALVFLALALDSAGTPIGVVNSDVATRLFLGDPQRGAMDRAVVLRDARQFTRAYPVGLFIDGVGPVVSNDAYATPKVWADFVRDQYHAPRVAWGREVNLFLLGVAYQARVGGGGDPAYARELHDAARRVLSAVEASGFKSELWSYDFVRGAPRAIRYGSGSDVQLWSTTDLAVQYALARWRR